MFWNMFKTQADKESLLNSEFPKIVFEYVVKN